MGDKGIFGCEKQHIAGQHITGGKANNIPRYNLGNIQLHICAVAQHIRLVGNHGGKLGCGSRAALALDKRDDAGNQNQPQNDDDCRIVRAQGEQHIRDKGDGGNEKQNDVKRVYKRLRQPGKHAGLLARYDDIWAKFLQPFLGLLVCQTRIQR